LFHSALVRRYWAKKATTWFRAWASDWRSGLKLRRFRAAKTMVCGKLLDTVDWLWPLKANVLSWSKTDNMILDWPLNRSVL